MNTATPIRTGPGLTCMHRICTSTTILVLLLIALFTSHATAQSRTGRGVSGEDKIVAQIVRELVLEARAMKDQRRAPGEEPDYASRTTLTPDAAAITRAILTTQHQDILVDAYVRWQLTSFDNLALPQMDDRTFTRALRSLPDLLENPRAAGDVVALFERAEKTARISDRERQMLQEMGRTLDTRSAIVEPFNRPANGLRRWLIEQLGDTGVRPHMVRIEWCAATIAGGWPTRAIKTDMTKTLTLAATDTTISRPDRMRLAGTLTQLAGRSRRFVSEVAFLANGSVEVKISNAQVTNQDVKRWSDRLLDTSGASGGS